MPEYLAPGVYVEEVDTGSKPIEGVSTSTAGFVGVTLRGAKTGLPQLVTNFADFVRKFGGHFDFGPVFLGHNYLPHAIEGFFANGGKRVYIMRVVADNPAVTASSAATAGGHITRLRENSVANGNKLKLANLRGVFARTAVAGTKLQLQMIKEGIPTTSAELEVTWIDRAAGEVTVSPNLPVTVFEARYTTVLTNLNGLTDANLPGTLAAMGDARDPSIKIKAKDLGSWGNAVVINVAHESGARSHVDSGPGAFSDPAGPNNNRVRLKSTAGFYAGAWVEIDRGLTKSFRRVNAVDGNVIVLDDQTAGAMTATDVTRDADPDLLNPPSLPADLPVVVSTAEFRLEVSYGGVTEEFSGLTLENVPGHYFLDRINNSSALITVEALPGAKTHPLAFPAATNGQNIVLGGGSNGPAPGPLDYKGADPGPGQRTGLKALEDIDQISIIAAPGVTHQVVQDALIEQCERLKDRFAILDPQPKTDNKPPDLNDVQTQRSLFDTKYAAIYYPRLLVFDPLSKQNTPLPPSGHVAGVYARTDIERGVHKAPANEVVRGITGLELKISKEEQDILNPSPVNVNVLRDFRGSGRGYRVWGARVITSDPDWKYVNVRRLFIFIEESIDEGTQWVVFEPNDEPLWERVRRTVSAFLTNVWRDGALQGRTPEEAFFVRCDRTTMTQADIDNGRLIILVGIAPVRPAEFVIFRIGQWAGGSSVEEG